MRRRWPWVAAPLAVFTVAAGMSAEGARPRPNVPESLEDACAGLRAFVHDGVGVVLVARRHPVVAF